MTSTLSLRPSTWASSHRKQRKRTTNIREPSSSTRRYMNTRRPREILTDHGPQFWAVPRGDSSFDAYCHKKEIKHILGGIGQQRSEKSNDGSEPPTKNTLFKLPCRSQRRIADSLILQSETPSKPRLLNASRGLPQPMSLQNVLDSRNCSSCPESLI